MKKVFLKSAYVPIIVKENEGFGKNPFASRNLKAYYVTGYREYMYMYI